MSGCKVGLHCNNVWLFSSLINFSLVDSLSWHDNIYFIQGSRALLKDAAQTEEVEKYFDTCK